MKNLTLNNTFRKFIKNKKLIKAKSQKIFIRFWIKQKFEHLYLWEQLNRNYKTMKTKILWTKMVLTDKKMTAFKKL